VTDSLNNGIRKITKDGIISTIAGNGSAVYSGDGGPALQAALNTPQGLAVDVAGNLFVADTFNNAIREISPDGTITTIAGNGTGGYSGDAGAATAASLFNPSAVLVDKFGNLYVADTNNNRVRKMNARGIITTIAGNGDINHFVAGDGGPAILASIFGPQGLAMDAAGNRGTSDNHHWRSNQSAGRDVHQVVFELNLVPIYIGLSSNARISVKTSTRQPCEIIYIRKVTPASSASDGRPGHDLPNWK